jgi:hypothetical protein
MSATKKSLNSCWCWSESVAWAFAFVLSAVDRMNALHWFHTPGDAVPSPCADRKIHNSELSYSLNTFHLLFVRSSNTPVEA